MAEAKFDTSKIKPGDTVLVRATVEWRCSDGDFMLHLPVTGGGKIVTSPVYVHPSAIVSHEPRELKAGDIVTVSGKSKPFQIIAIDCLRAFLKPHDNTVYSHCVHHLSELERAP